MAIRKVPFDAITKHTHRRITNYRDTKANQFVCMILIKYKRIKTHTHTLSAQRCATVQQILHVVQQAEDALVKWQCDLRHTKTNGSTQ